MPENTQVSDTLKLLQRGPRTAMELLACGIRHPRQAVCILRRHGHQIASRRTNKGQLVTYVYRGSRLPVNAYRASLKGAHIIAVMQPRRWYSAGEVTAMVSHYIEPEAALRTVVRKRYKQGRSLEENVLMGKRSLVSSRLPLLVRDGVLKQKKSRQHDGRRICVYALARQSVRRQPG